MMWLDHVPQIFVLNKFGNSFASFHERGVPLQHCRLVSVSPSSFEALAFETFKPNSCLTISSLWNIPLHHPSRGFSGFLWAHGLSPSTAYLSCRNLRIWANPRASFTVPTLLATSPGVISQDFYQSSLWMIPESVEECMWIFLMPVIFTVLCCLVVLYFVDQLSFYFYN